MKRLPSPIVCLIFISFGGVHGASPKYGSFEIETNQDLFQVEYKPTIGKIFYQSETSPQSVGDSLYPINTDELVGIWDENHNYHNIHPLSIDQVLQMPSGTFLLPIVEPTTTATHDNQDGSFAGSIVKFLRVEIVSADALEFRPRQAERRDLMNALQLKKGRRPSIPTAPPPHTCAPAFAEVPPQPSPPDAPTLTARPMPTIGAAVGAVAVETKAATASVAAAKMHHQAIADAAKKAEEETKAIQTEANKHTPPHVILKATAGICQTPLSKEECIEYGETFEKWAGEKDWGDAGGCLAGIQTGAAKNNIYWNKNKNNKGCDAWPRNGCVCKNMAVAWPTSAALATQAAARTTGAAKDRAEKAAEEAETKTVAAAAVVAAAVAANKVEQEAAEVVRLEKEQREQREQKEQEREKQALLTFNNQLFVFEPAIIRVMGSLASVSYPGGTNQPFVQHLKKHAISSSDADPEHLCACSYSNVDNDVMTMCLIDAIVPTVKESDELCKPICTQLDEGNVVQRGTVLTTMLPVVKEYSQLQMFEHQKALAKVQALVNAKRATLEANGEDPTSDDNVKLLEHIEKKNAAIQHHTKTGEISIEMQEEITPAEEKEQYMFNELKFPNKGPLGLTLIPGKLPFTIESKSHNLLPGDEMVSINGEDVLDAETEQEIFEILIEASYPKTIKFRRKIIQKNIVSAQTRYETKMSKGRMILAAPHILAGYGIPFTVAEFGVLRRIDVPSLTSMEGAEDVASAAAGTANVCDPKFNIIQLRTVIPLEGCSNIHPLQRRINDTHVDNSVVYGVVKRGVCSFTKKAELVEAAGFNGMIVIDEEKYAKDDLIRMPAKRNFNTNKIVPIDFRGQAILINAMNGALIHTSMVSGSTPEQTFALSGVLRSAECLKFKLPTTWVDSIHGLNGIDDSTRNLETVTKAVENTKALLIQHNIDSPDGYLYMWNGRTYSRELPVAVGGFGEMDRKKLNEIAPSRIVMGVPEDGCDEKGFSNNVKGAWVIVKRGGCSFLEKARTIQRVGGILGILLNTRKKPYLFEMPHGEGANDVTIPFIMLPYDSEEEIAFMKRESGGHLLGRLNVPD